MAKKTSIRKPAKAAVDKPAATVSDLFELSSVRLLNCNSELILSDQMKPPFTVEMNFTIKLHEGAKIKVALVDVGVNLSLKPQTETKHPDFPKLSAVFQVVFTAKGEFPIMLDNDRKMLLKTGATVAWPYLRNFVQSTISMMTLPPVVLPMFQPAQFGEAIARVGEADLKEVRGSVTRRRRRK